MSELVTGEAVVLDLRLAKLASRGLAFAIDVAIQFGALFVVLVIFATSAGSLDDALATAVTLVAGVTVMIGYPVLLETLTRGRTVGKIAMGLRVVRDDGGPVRFRHALIRGLTGFFVDFWVLGLAGAVAIFVSLASTKGKRVGDFLAATVVVRERMPKTAEYPVTMPPSLAGWAAGLNVAAVTDALALAVRQYLSRYDQLDPRARDTIGALLALQISGYLGVPVPADSSAPWYLAAVLAERRNREHARLTGPPPDPRPPAPAPPVPGTGEPTRDDPFAPPG